MSGGSSPGAGSPVLPPLIRTGNLPANFREWPESMQRRFLANAGAVCFHSDAAPTPRASRAASTRSSRPCISRSRCVAMEVVLFERLR